MVTMIDKYRVAIQQADATHYPNTPPFSPSHAYPEYPFSDRSSEGWVYDGVRQLLRQLGLDAEHLDAPTWNPLGQFVHPGDKVVVKPNLVLDFNESGQGTDCLITHASVLRPIVDYVWIALQGKGQIIVADSPHGNADFAAIRRAARLDDLEAFYAQQQIPFEIRDLRRYEYGHGPRGFIERRRTVELDPEGYVEIDLGTESAFVDLPHIENLYGADFDRREIRRYHNRTTNKYLVARTFLTADVIINVPKLKTHKKIGTTLNVKSLIGINGDKNYLPHFRIGDPPHGGDEFPPVESRLEWGLRRARRWLFDHLLGDNENKRIRLYKFLNLFVAPAERAYVMKSPQGRRITSGDWHGNETVYRTVYDLSRVIFNADRDGAMQSTPQRRFFSIIDGIVAGEREGPLAPTPKPCGVLIAGVDPIAVDLAATRLMGLDPEQMVVFSRLDSLPPHHPLQPVSYDRLDIVSNRAEWSGNIFATRDRYLALTPHRGWINFLEIGARS